MAVWCGVVYVNRSMGICCCLPLHHTSSHTPTFPSNSYCFFVECFFFSPLLLYGCWVSNVDAFLLSTHFKWSTKPCKSLHFYQFIFKLDGERTESSNQQIIQIQIASSNHLINVDRLAVNANSRRRFCMGFGEWQAYSCVVMSMYSALRVDKFTEPKW